MAEALKHVYSKDFFIKFLSSWKKINPKVEPTLFLDKIYTKDWEALELKERMSKIAITLSLFLNSDFKKAANELKTLTHQLLIDGFSKDSFEFMFIPEFIEKNGIDDLDISLDAMGTITQFTSCEFAIRPFIIRYSKDCMAQMLIWSKAKDESLRRFSSEGCRPRLPWAMALPHFKKDPTPILAILENLKNDSSLFVRKSVANNLNDISKDNQDLILTILKKWKGKSKNTDWIVKHACRTLLKAGNPVAMKLFGYAAANQYQLKSHQLNTENVKMNSSLNFEFAIENTSNKPITLRLEYGIDFLKANGKQNRKVFMISERELKPKESIQMSKKHKIKPISTRKYYEGDHGLALIINGIEQSKAIFQLTF